MAKGQLLGLPNWTLKKIKETEKIVEKTTINGKSLSENIILTAEDVNADEKGAAQTVQNSLDNHTTSIHFTQEEREKLSGIETKANNYVHPASGIEAGTYKSVTVDAQGHITGGTNPTTLAEYGITDAEEKGTASSTVSAHNVATDTHNDIRLLITGLTDRLNALANSDDTTLDQMKEVVDYIKANRELIESITTTKVNVSDIIDNLTTNVSDKPLSASQGVVLKGLIDSLQIAVNSKASSTDLTTHTGNRDIHVTTEDKTNWDNKAELVHTHSIANIANLQNELDKKAYGIRWNAVIMGQTWSRICLCTPSNNNTGGSFLLNVGFTRGNTVGNATFLITTSHAGANYCLITQLSSNNYSSFKIRGVCNQSGVCYIEMYDNANSIAATTSQIVNCSWIPILGYSITKYEAFTSGATIPNGYIAYEHSVTIGGAMVAPKFIGPLSGNADTASKLLTSGKQSMTFNWSGQEGQPTWLWGGNDTSNMYVYNPSNFNVKHAGSATLATTANNLTYFQNTSNTAISSDDVTANGIMYTNTGLLGSIDGALFKQVYSDKWVAEIWEDYRTGQLCTRGKNNGTWQGWRVQLDDQNFRTYVTPANIGAAVADHTHSIANITNLQLSLNSKLDILNLGSTTASAIYESFAYMDSANSVGNGHATFLITGMGNFGGTIQGSCIVTISNRNSVATMEVTILSSWNSGTVKFGYYTLESKFYFGIYAESYRGSLNVATLQNAGATVNSHYKSTTKPSGWTEVTPRILQDNVVINNLQTQINNKVQILTNMEKFPVTYGFAISRIGDTIDVANGSDNYYMLVDSNNDFRTGVQLNGASAVTWAKYSKEGHTHNYATPDYVNSAIQTAIGNAMSASY